LTNHIEINEWAKFVELTHKSNGWKNWVFRGQSDYSWDLKTSLERAANDLGVPLYDLPNFEQGMVRKFKRQFAHYSNNKPVDNDYVEWLSIMQHYGCPTRLLDFSYSIFIGLFFAVINCNVGREAAVWCVDSKWLNTKYQNYGPKEYAEELNMDKKRRYIKLNKIVLKNTSPFLYAINPYHLNKRLSIQQGIFLIPTDLTIPYMDNLKATIMGPSDRSMIKKIKIKCKQKFIDDSFYYLNRMNINDSTHFPGLDGFSRYLKMLMKVPGAIYSASREFI